MLKTLATMTSLTAWLSSGTFVSGMPVLPTPDVQNPATQPPVAAAAPPDTEIFLAPLTVASGTLTVGAPTNITDSPGYDNQPAFTPDGRSILFSSVRGPAPAASPPSASSPAAPPNPAAIPATDIYRYDIASRQVVRVTSTPEGEFSPTVMPDGRRISVIRVEADGSQRLWSFATDGQSPALVLADVKPVGYHAWIDDHTLALFVLGNRGEPATLQVADTKTGKAEVIARDIGTSVKRMPSGAVSFVQREPRGGATAAAVTVKQLTVNPTDRQVSTLVRPVTGANQPDLAWMPDGTLLMAHGGTLYRWRAGDPDWTTVASLEALGLRGVTRMAVSPGGEMIAIVGQSR